MPASLPSSSKNNTADLGLAHSVFFGKVGLGDGTRPIPVPYFFGFIVRQFHNLALNHDSAMDVFSNSSSSRLPWPYPESSLFRRIVHVVFGGSYKEMLRIAAAPIVAAMANVKSLWYCTISKFPGNPMSTCGFSPNLALTIPCSFDYTAHPVPASFIWPTINSSPKPKLERTYVPPLNLCTLSAKSNAFFVCSHGMNIPHS